MYDLKKYKILFVDDEVETLNAFKTFFDNDFEIITAINSIEAEKILEEKNSEIAILISDHIMQEGVSGLGLLKICSERWPFVIRILTTAYSEYKLVLDAINSEVVYKYIVKPWSVDELKITLIRAMEFFLMRGERDLLLKEKMGILKQLILSDRTRAIMAFSAGLMYHLRNTPEALKDFFKLAPEVFDNMIRDNDNIDTLDFWKNFTAKAGDKVRNFTKLIKLTGESVIAPNKDFDKNLSIDKLLQDAIQNDISNFSGTVRFDIDSDIKGITANKKQLSALFRIIFKYIAGSGVETVCFSTRLAVKDKQGYKITISGNSANELKIDDNTWNLLPVFLIVHHHDGQITINKERIEITLPFEPDYDKAAGTGEDYLIKMLEHFEIIKHYEAWIDAFFLAE